MGKKKYGDAGGQVRQVDNVPVQRVQIQSTFQSTTVNKFSTQLNPVAGGAWNFAARFLLSAAAGDPQVMSGDVVPDGVGGCQDMSESRLR